MAMDTILQQGRFNTPGANAAAGTTATGGVPQILEIRSDVDWIKVYNNTKSGVAGTANALGIEFYWQRGMAAGTGIVRYYSNGSAILNGDTLLTGGFTLIDSTANPVGAAVAVTAITNAAQPVASTGNTGALVSGSAGSMGSIVRLERDTGPENIMGFDYEVDAVVANTSFRMRFALANAPGVVGAGNGFYRHIAFDPIYYPRRRFVVNITQAASAVVTTSVTHGYTVGQAIRLIVPAAFGMTEMNNLIGTITAVTDGTFTVNIDSTAFTAFAFPNTTATPALFPFTWAEAVPVGEDTGQALTSGADILADATRNTGFLGIRLGIGGNGAISGANIVGPAGTITTSGGGVQVPDQMYWVAGKSFSVNNL